MKDFKSKKFGDRRNSGGGYGDKRGRGGFSGGGGFRSRDNDRRGRERGGFQNRSFDRGPKQMFDATCADCGDDCQVPFRPTGDRPVKCSNCFDKHTDRGFGGDRPSRGRDDRSFKKEFSAPKPDARIDELKAELRSVQSKLDTLIALMDRTGAAPVKKSTAKAKKETVEAAPILFDYTPDVPEPKEVPAKKPRRVIPSKEEAVAGIMKAKKEVKKKAATKKK